MDYAATVADENKKGHTPKEICGDSSAFNDTNSETIFCESKINKEN